MLGRATAAVPPPAPLPRRWARIRLAAKAIVLGLGGYQVQTTVEQSLTWRHVERTELSGNWIVDHHVERGVELPATDASRWHRIAIDQYGWR